MRKNQSRLEWVWQGSQSLGDTAQIFAGELYGGCVVTRVVIARTRCVRISEVDAIWWRHPIYREGCTYVEDEPCSGILLRNLHWFGDVAAVGSIKIGGAEGEQNVEEEKYVDAEINHRPAQAPPMEECKPIRQRYGNERDWQVARAKRERTRMG